MSISEIGNKARALEAKVLAPGYQATARDVSEAQELVSQCIDELERLEQTATVSPVTDIEPIAEFILKRWYPND